MKCPNCQTENPAGAKFCSNCGTKFNTRCTNCQSELAPGARFCSNCGQPVGGATPVEDERRNRLVANTPAPVAEKMHAAHLAGERKVVTVLFLDVVGSTALAENMDPEDWTLIMNRAFDVLSPIIITSYEGAIARLLGDAILAFLGRRSRTRTTRCGPCARRWICSRRPANTPRKFAPNMASSSPCASA
jgi:class 3 adenylate cyclase